MSNNIQSDISETELLQKFAQKYAPPLYICKIIDDNKKAILKMPYRQFLINGTVWAKGDDINRLINAERMRSCILKNNLTCLDVAKKYAYCINGQWKLFVEWIEGREPGDFLDYESKQLRILERETGFVDYGMDKPNVLRTSNGKLVFIDTEDISFNSDKHAIPNSDRFDSPDMNFEKIKYLLKNSNYIQSKL